jgi:hypothetical protein
MYNVFSNIARNVGVTPNQLPADAQTAMTQHPYATDVGSVIGGTAAALPISAAAEFAAPFVGLGGTGLVPSIATGAGTGAVQNALAGNPDESLARRAGTGAALGAGFGALGQKVGSWFGAGRSIEPEVAAAAKNLQQEGVTDIRLPNVDPATQPGGSIKAAGAPPTFAQAGQIDNSVSKILGDDVPNFNPTNFKAVQNRIGGAASAAANSGRIDVNAPLAPGGPTFSDVLTQIQSAASAHPEVASQINPLISRIQARVGSGGIISGKDFDNLVGSGSVLHDLVGADNPYVKEAAQALDSTMDAGFKASSPAGAYDDWVDNRTKYRMLMGVRPAVLPNGHINPTTLFNGIQNRFTDLKGAPISTDPLVGRMGQFASSVKTVFGGGAPPPQAGGPSFLQSLGIGGVGAGAVDVAHNVLSGNSNILNPENLLSPAALATGATGLGGAALRWAGQRFQQSPGFVNALINAGGAPIANALNPGLSAVGTQLFPQRQPGQ